MSGLGLETWGALGPVLPLLAVVLFYLVAERKLRESGADRLMAWLGVGASAASAFLITVFPPRLTEAFGGLLSCDAVSSGMGAVILVASAASILLFPRYASERGLACGDFTALVLMAASGLLVLVEARELLTAILALETASVCLYALTGYDRHRASSAEAALKYFLPGAVASAVLLYGAACYYGATGTTRLVVSPLLATPLGMLGAGLLLSGLAFKAGLVPFHGWLPDAYCGAPAPATAFMAAAVKAGAFAVMGRLVVLGLPSSSGIQACLALLAVATMTFGNLAGLAQTALKRLLAYSAIAHSGYILLGITAAAKGASLGPVLSYLAAYGLLTVGAFAVAGILESSSTGGLEIAQLRGLAKRRPVLALALAFCLLGLAGFPPTVGFLAKVSVFSVAYAKSLGWLVVVAALNSAVALGYYLKPVLAMFMAPAPEGAALPDADLPRFTMASIVAVACGVGGILLGLTPSLWM